MNIQEILNYRKACLIHESEPLKPHIFFFRSFLFFSHVELAKDSLIVRNQDPSMMNFEAIKQSKTMEELNIETTLVFKWGRRSARVAKLPEILESLGGKVAEGVLTTRAALRSDTKAFH